MKIAFFITCGLLGLVLGLYLWELSIAPNIELEHEQVEPKRQWRIEDHLTFIEFELADGTPCVMVSSPSSQPVRLAGPSIPGRGGVSCNWEVE